MRTRVGAGLEGKASVGAIGRHRTPAHDTYRVAHHTLFRDHLFDHAVAVYRRIVWTQNLRVDELELYIYSWHVLYLYIEALLFPRG